MPQDTPQQQQRDGEASPRRSRRRRLRRQRQRQRTNGQGSGSDTAQDTHEAANDAAPFPADLDNRNVVQQQGAADEEVDFSEVGEPRVPPLDEHHPGATQPPCNALSEDLAPIVCTPWTYYPPTILKQGVNYLYDVAGMPLDELKDLLVKESSLCLVYMATSLKMNTHEAVEMLARFAAETPRWMVTPPDDDDDECKADAAKRGTDPGQRPRVKRRYRKTPRLVILTQFSGFCFVLMSSCHRLLSAILALTNLPPTESSSATPARSTCRYVGACKNISMKPDTRETRNSFCAPSAGFLRPARPFWSGMCSCRTHR